MAENGSIRSTTARNGAGPGLRTVFRIFEAWGLTSREAMTLLGLPPSTFYAYKRDPGRARLSADRLERISYLLGIHKALEILLPNPTIADSWIRHRSDAPMFGGRSPLDRMLGGQVGDLYVVRRYLDGQ